MTHEEEFSALVEKIRSAKAEDAATLAVWKAANKRLTDLGNEMQALIGRATRTAQGTEAGTAETGTGSVHDGPVTK